MAWIQSRYSQVLLLVVTVLLSACQGVDSYSGRIVFSGELQLDREIAVDGDLIILEGKVLVPAESQITGSIYMLGGTLQLEGQVNGDLTILDGSLMLGADSSVGGNLYQGSDEVIIHPETEIKGQIVDGFALPTEWVRQEPTFTEQVRSSLMQMSALGLLAMVLKRYLPGPLARVRSAIFEHTLISTTVGVLSVVVSLVLFIQLAFTVLLIPISIAGLAFMFLMIAVGWAAIGAWLAKMLRPKLPDSISTLLLYGFCAGLVSVVIDALGYVPIVGTPIVLLSASAGFGALLLTRFGFHTFTPSMDDDLL